jgi:uncharacterized membrane protein (UPF0127 family)
VAEHPHRNDSWRTFLSSFWKAREDARPLGCLAVRNETKQTTLAERADIADDSSRRRKGLLGRKSLEPGQGLWIVPCQGVHCLGMQFAIDVVFLDRRRKVSKLRPDVRPGGVALCLWAHSVLELPSGTIRQTQTSRGDQLRLTFPG